MKIKQRLKVNFFSKKKKLKNHPEMDLEYIDG
jgi:hypothetical protein